MIVMGLMAGIPVGAICAIIFVLFGNDEKEESYRSLSTKFAFLGIIVCLCALSLVFWSEFGWGMWSWGFLGLSGWLLLIFAITGFWHELDGDFSSDLQAWICGVGFWIFGGGYIILEMT